MRLKITGGSAKIYLIYQRSCCVIESQNFLRSLRWDEGQRLGLALLLA